MGFLTFRRRKELTLNLEYNVDSPSTTCDRRDNFLVPNGETGSACECLIRGRIIEPGEQGVHAEHDQQRSAGKGQIPKELEGPEKTGVPDIVCLEIGCIGGSTHE